MASPKVVIMKGKGVNMKKEMHSIPCKTNYTGPANVQGYFMRETLEEGMETAALRGRKLSGKKMELAHGFNAAVLVNKGTGRHEVERQLDNISYWEHDRQPSDRSSLSRAVSFLPIAAALSAPSKSL